MVYQTVYVSQDQYAPAPPYRPSVSLSPRVVLMTKRINAIIKLVHTTQKQKNRREREREKERGRVDQIKESNESISDLVACSQ